jgi:hypothetical protein
MSHVTLTQSVTLGLFCMLPVNYAKPNQKPDFVPYNCEFIITKIVITEIIITKFDCTANNFCKVRKDLVGRYSDFGQNT